MEIQKSFSKTAFGGFNKEEVIQYISEIITKSDKEIASLKSEKDGANAQIIELKTIIEEQYQKIVDLNAANEALKEQNDTGMKRINELEEKLKPFIDAQAEAKAIVEAAQAEANELSITVKQKVSDTTEQAKAILEQAAYKAKEMIDPAKLEVQTMLTSATKKAQEIITSARSQESEYVAEIKTQLEETLAMSEENEKRTKTLVEDAKLEAKKIIEAAKLQAEQEKNHYDSCLKELEMQKSKFLLSLDEIKSSVQAIQIVRLPKGDIESLQALKTSTTEAIRKKFAMLNNSSKPKNP